jgi:polysaccharide export outer membrane protein
MRLRQFVTIVGAFLIISGALAAPPAPPHYRFAPGDVIDVTVEPQRDFDRSVTVQPDGKISYPLIGQLQAAGLTVEQLAGKLGDALNRELVDPHVIVALKESNKQALGRVSLLGAVRSPGAFELKDGTTLAEVLASGGGPSPRADLRRVTITRADQSVVTDDLAQTEKTGQVGQNLVLQPGDIIVVPEGELQTILMLGEVTKPGSYEISGEARLLDVLTQAGGLTPKADLRRVTLARAGAGGTRTIDLQPLLVRGDRTDPDLNVLLQPGDTVFIAETQQQVYVLGSVDRPGIYALKPGARVLDMLVAAGGAGAGASKAVLVRRDANGQPAGKPLNLKKIMSKGDMAENEPLRPGDVLYVPDKKSPQSGGALGLIWPLTGLINLFR